LETEPTPEELAKHAEEKKEREDANESAKGEWDALDDNTKFFRTCEDPFKEASIRFLFKEDAGEDTPDPSVVDATLVDASLRAFESSVCDQKGCWVYFDKVVPREEETSASIDPKAKKPAAKASKAVSAEDVQKPTHGRAWLNLMPLLTGGTKQVTQRVFLSQIAASESNYPIKRDDQSEFVGSVSAAQDGLDQSEQFSLQDIFMDHQTYAYLTIELSESLYPQADYNIIKADGRSLTEKYPEVNKFPSSRQAITEFEDALHFIVQ
jgi:hypothetical protein